LNFRAGTEFVEMEIHKTPKSQNKLTIFAVRRICIGHDIIQRQITQKRYKIELYLQWSMADQ